MKAVQVGGLRVPASVVQEFLLKPGVAEEVAKAAFHARGVAVPYGEPEDLENPPLRIEWFVYSDHIRIDWWKQGYEEFPVLGYRHETEQPLKEAPEDALGTRIVASELLTGTRREPISPGQSFFFSFFVPYPVDLAYWFLRWAYKDPGIERKGWLAFSVFVPSETRYYVRRSNECGMRTSACTALTRSGGSSTASASKPLDARWSG